MNYSIYKRISNKLSETKFYLQHPNFTRKKFLNYLMINIQAKIFKNSQVFGYPYRIYIDPTTFCNLRCPLCPTGSGEDTNPKGKLLYNNFKKIIDEVYPYIYDLHIYRWGEPFLNKDIFDMVSYAKGKNIYIYISTNLNYLTEEMAIKMVDSGLDHLLIAIDGVRQETYEQYRIGGDLNKALNNLRAIVKAKTHRNSTKPLLEWRYLLMRHNENEVEIAKELSKKIGVDKFVVEPVRVHIGRDIVTEVGQRIEKDMMWLPINDKRYDHERRTTKIPLGNCTLPWTLTVINWDGMALPCCSAYDETFNFGNVFVDGFKTIWNNGKYQLARKINSWKGVKEDTNVVCSFCNKYNIKYRKVFENEKQDNPCLSETRSKR